MSPTRVQRSAERFVTPTSWGESRHCFSFGDHYDPDNVGFGLLMALNEEVLPPGEGFDEHEHRDVEIVTWVLEGALDHEDSAGNGGVARAGVVRRLSAGAGVSHSERNDATSPGPVRFVQSWVRPAEPGGEPGYEQLDVSGALAACGLVVVASGMGDADAVRIEQPGARLLVARVEERCSVTLPAAPFVHVFVGRGAVDVAGGGRLAEGDSLRLTTGKAAEVTAATDAEVLVWEMHPEPSPT
jgi:redox-sensitive bicupin YhaK (pirin superfamily)